MRLSLLCSFAFATLGSCGLHRNEDAGGAGQPSAGSSGSGSGISGSGGLNAGRGGKGGASGGGRAGSGGSAGSESQGGASAGEAPGGAAGESAGGGAGEESGGSSGSSAGGNHTSGNGGSGASGASGDGGSSGEEGGAAGDGAGGGTCQGTEPSVAPGASCAELATNCGAATDADCCSSLLVTGGEFDRDEVDSYPATVSDFRLDRFEVTVGRFRRFVAIYDCWEPAAGTGEHRSGAGTGWSAEWNKGEELPANSAALREALECPASTWRDTAGTVEEENLPINCMSWYLAFAFCSWDGGRLPTEAEWEYAAAGGSQERRYPWGAAEPDPTLAVYGCLADGDDTCSSAADILPVGARPSGDGFFGHADLAGSMGEWVFDFWSSNYAVPCEDCANTTATDSRVFRGGSWNNAADNVRAAGREVNGPLDRYEFQGVRCARPAD